VVNQGEEVDFILNYAFPHEGRNSFDALDDFI